MQEPLWQLKHWEALAAGKHKCKGFRVAWNGSYAARTKEVCGFVYFKTTDTCPLCGTTRKE